jgi:hypothetical protein
VPQIISLSFCIFTAFLGPSSEFEAGRRSLVEGEAHARARIPFVDDT